LVDCCFVAGFLVLDRDNDHGVVRRGHRKGFGIERDAVDHGEVLPGATLHGKIFKIAEFVRKGIGVGRFQSTLHLLHGLPEDVVLLPQLRCLQGVDPNELVFLHMDALNVLIELLPRRHPLGLLLKQLGFSELHGMERILEIGDDVGKLLLLLFQFLGMDLLALAGVESGYEGLGKYDVIPGHVDLRGLSVSKQALLLLELLDLVIVARLRNQLIDIAEGALRRNLKSGVLFPNPIATQV
jgi:hypothetical protein